MVIIATLTDFTMPMELLQSLVDLHDVFLRRAKHDLLPFSSLVHLAVDTWQIIVGQNQSEIHDGQKSLNKKPKGR